MGQRNVKQHCSIRYDAISYKTEGIGTISDEPFCLEGLLLQMGLDRGK